MLACMCHTWRGVGVKFSIVANRSGDLPEMATDTANLAEIMVAPAAVVKIEGDWQMVARIRAC